MAQPASSAGSQAFGPRLASALVLAAAALGLAYIGGVAFNLLIVAAAALMAYEWNALCCRGVSATGAAVGGAVVGCVGIAALGFTNAGLVAVLPVAALTLVVARFAGVRTWWPAAGVVYVAVPCIAIVWLRASPAFGLETIVWLFAAVWATDVGAYFAGRGIGGPRLAPRISPNKTWAGLAGGIAAAALVGMVTAYALGLPDRMMLVSFSALLAIIAQGGDLIESTVKRHFGVKDSGRLIPGHGGILDRLDGLMTAAPVVAAAALLSGEQVLAWR